MNSTTFPENVVARNGFAMCFAWRAARAFVVGWKQIVSKTPWKKPTRANWSWERSMGVVFDIGVGLFCFCLV